ASGRVGHWAADRSRSALAWVDTADQIRLARSTSAATLLLAVLSMAASAMVRPAIALRVATSSANGRAARPDPGLKADPSRRAPARAARPSEPAAARPAPAAAPAAPAPAPAPPAVRGALPVGKGMWIWHPNQTDGGDPG